MALYYSVCVCVRARARAHVCMGRGGVSHHFPITRNAEQWVELVHNSYVLWIYGDFDGRLSNCVTIRPKVKPKCISMHLTSIE